MWRRIRCEPTSIALGGSQTDHPDVIRLRELSRTEESLGEDLRRVVNQLYQLLLRYYPQLLRLNSVPDEPWIWALREAAPAPQRAHEAWWQRAPPKLLHRLRARIVRKSVGFRKNSLFDVIV
jgi:hypothetical protein